MHALRFASVPVVSVLGIQFIALFGGSVIIENLFALPGLGQASQAAAVLPRLPGADRRGGRRHDRRRHHQPAAGPRGRGAGPEGAYRMSVLPLDAADEVDAPTPGPADPPAAAAAAVLPAPPGRHLRRRLAAASWSSPRFTAPLWRPYEVDEQDLANRLALPSAAHWLAPTRSAATCSAGSSPPAREPLLGSVLTVLVAFGIGLPLALLAAERGRRVERVTSRLTEVLMALPGTILLLAVIGAIGVKTYIVMAILGVLISAAVYRVMLGVAQSVRRGSTSTRPGSTVSGRCGSTSCTCCRRWPPWSPCRPRSCSASAC